MYFLCVFDVCVRCAFCLCGVLCFVYVCVVCLCVCMYFLCVFDVCVRCAFCLCGVLCFVYVCVVCVVCVFHISLQITLLLSNAGTIG